MPTKDNPARGLYPRLLKEGRDRRMIPRYIKPEITIAHKYGLSGIIKGNRPRTWTTVLSFLAGVKNETYGSVKHLTLLKEV